MQNSMSPMHKKDIITKRGSKRGKIFLQNAAAFLLQNAPILLQNVADITKRVIYYKTGHNIYQ